MAKLSDLKTLLDARRAAEPANAPGVPAAPRRDAGTHREPVLNRPAATRPHPPASHGHAQPAKAVAASKRALAASKHADGDIDLASAFADVKRMPPVNRAIVDRPRPAPIARHREADEQDALLASKFGDEPSPHSWDIGQELEGEQTFLRAGLGPDVLSKLRRGHWSLQGEIDLHGFTTDEARDVLADFLLDARSRGARCVRVIHGKGLTSPNKEPVLKGKVRKWLAHWDDVLAYCEAPRHAGGGGAVMILLRGK